MKRFASRQDCAALSAAALTIMATEACAQPHGVPPQVLLQDLKLQPLAGAPALRTGGHTLQIELKLRREAERFERGEARTGVALAPGTVIFLQSRKLKDDTPWDLPEGATKGKTYSIGLATRW